MKVLYILFLLDTLNLSIFIPLFSAFISSLGGTPFTYGLINSCSALISLLWNPVVGSLSDQIGRKGLLIKCMIASSIGSLILCASTTSLILAFIGKMIGALGSPVAILLRSTATDTFKTDEDKNNFFNKSAPVISVAFLVGSLASGFLSEVNNGYSLAFLLMAALMGIASVVAQTNLPEDSKLKEERKEENSLAQKALQELKAAVRNISTISWPRYRLLFIMKGLYDFSMCTAFSNFGFILSNEYKIEGRYLGYVFFMISLFSIASNILKLKLNDTFASMPDNEKIVKVGIVLPIAFLSMSLFGSVSMFLLSMCIMFLARTLMDGFWTEMITSKTLDNDRGKVIAAFDNLTPLMMFVAPLLSGLVAEAYGERLLLGFASIPISLAILIANNRRNKTD